MTKLSKDIQSLGRSRVCDLAQVTGVSDDD